MWTDECPVVTILRATCLCSLLQLVHFSCCFCPIEKKKSNIIHFWAAINLIWTLICVGKQFNNDLPFSLHQISPRPLVFHFRLSLSLLFRLCSAMTSLLYHRCDVPCSSAVECLLRVSHSSPLKQHCTRSCPSFIRLCFSFSSRWPIINKRPRAGAVWTELWFSHKLINLSLFF